MCIRDRLSADDVDILVHGTSFRVSSYVNDSEVEVALLSGAIDMQTKNLQQNCKIQMTPGDMVKVDKRSGGWRSCSGVAHRCSAPVHLHLCSYS